MAGVYRKKRRHAGPSKNEEKVSRSKEAEFLNRASNSLGARFPSVVRMTVRLDFLGPQQQLLSQETRAFGPGDPCEFSAPCPGTCGVGNFDLAAKIAKVIEAGEAVSESSGVCQERLFAGSAAACNCQLRCRVEIVYQPQPAA